MQFENSHSDRYRSYASVVDGGTPVDGRTRSFDKQIRYAIADHLRWDIPGGGYVECNFDMSNDDGRGFRMDTLTSTATRRELQSTSDGLTRRVTAYVFEQIMLSEEKFNYLSFSYKYTWEKSRRKKISLDLADAGLEMIDSTNTYNFTNNYNMYKAGVAAHVRLDLPHGLHVLSRRSRGMPRRIPSRLRRWRRPVFRDRLLLRCRSV